MTIAHRLNIMQFQQRCIGTELFPFTLTLRVLEKGSIHDFMTRDL